MSVLVAITRGDVADYVEALFLVYLVLIFIRVLLSWVPRMPYNLYLRAGLDVPVAVGAHRDHAVAVGDPERQPRDPPFAPVALDERIDLPQPCRCLSLRGRARGDEIREAEGAGRSQTQGGARSQVEEAAAADGVQWVLLPFGAGRLPPKTAVCPPRRAGGHLSGYRRCRRCPCLLL